MKLLVIDINIVSLEMEKKKYSTISKLYWK